MWNVGFGICVRISYAEVFLNRRSRATTNVFSWAHWFVTSNAHLFISSEIDKADRRNDERCRIHVRRMVQSTDGITAPLIHYIATLLQYMYKKYEICGVIWICWANCDNVIYMSVYFQQAPVIKGNPSSRWRLCATFTKRDLMRLRRVWAIKTSVSWEM